MLTQEKEPVPYCHCHKFGICHCLNLDAAHWVQETFHSSSSSPRFKIIWGARQWGGREERISQLNVIIS